MTQNTFTLHTTSVHTPAHLHYTQKRAVEHHSLPEFTSGGTLCETSLTYIYYLKAVQTFWYARSMGLSG